MNRLIAFGCSHTWGDHLSEDQNGVFNKDAPPHKESWPYILGEILEREVINISYPGESNKAISHKIFNFDFHPSDIVIPLWTHVGRHCIIDKIDKSDPYNYRRHNTRYIGKGDKLTEMYYRDYHTLDDEYYQIISFIQSTNFTFQTKVLKFINCFATLEVLNFVKANSKKLSIFNVPFYEGYCKYGRALDGTHLNKEAHRRFAQDVSKTIHKGPTPLI